MKLKLAILSLVALTASCTVALARTDAPAADTNQPPATTATADAAATTPSTNAAPAQTPTATPAPAPDAAAAPTAAPAPAVLAQAAPAPAPAPAAVAADANAPHDPNAVIPLIVMDEVPLTDAIKNLARQAGLNYMLDPKINYGTPDANGVVRAQPNVSLRWENLTADQALLAVLNNYNLVIIDDPKTHIARISIKDPAAPDPLVTKIVQLKFSDPSNMVTSVQTVLLDKRSKVIADNRTSQLVLVATEREIVEADQLVARLDTPTKEVLIEAKLVELQKNPTTSKGVDWTATLGSQHVAFGNNILGGQRQIGTFSVATNIAGGFIITSNVNPNNVLPPPGTGPGLLADTAHGLNPATAFLDADGLNAVISFLNTEADAKILSTPRAVTLDNQEATLSVTIAEPIFKATAGTQGSPGGSEVTYTNVGTILKVTPRISANNYINLRVIPEVSDIGGTVSKTVSGLVSQADFFDVRKIDTHVLIPSGNTLVMGGLISDQSSKGNTKVPFLGDIPVLGWAFRSEAKSQHKQNLIIFITPTIVQNEDFQPTQTSFLKTRMDDKPMAEFKAWDRGEPQDWSKLFHSKKGDNSSDDASSGSTSTSTGSTSTAKASGGYTFQDIPDSK